ncbi:hypothetical protein C475_02106 [Halosimplex carlsbadense 2-9-1]|uniref:DUF8056 domain-containing protein n=1 Tax=Halosimplex carlsbadense 2-9-1 TaxID=797114 RepID=M0D4T3_9EURY|nr:hypothetical protein [Halosimplex carlsbadense]ELZ29702.1 hypothetical protein C475_02106 [Halosimplex carlsbadense 2-9-1]
MSDATDEVSADGEVARSSGDGSDAAETYKGLLTAYPYAFRASDSMAFRIYTGVSALFGIGVVLLFTFAVVTLLGSTADASGGSFTFSRAFFLFLMFLVLAPLVAPVLFVARRHRRVGSDTRYDRQLAATGYGFLLAMYVALVITTPADLRDNPDGAFGAVAEFLYGLPNEAAIVPPVGAALLIYLTHRRLR